MRTKGDGLSPFASALEAAGAIRRRRVSAVELVRAVLARIEAVDPKINAVVALGADAALERAREADRALSRGKAWGPLHGVPVVSKGTIEVAGLRTTAGAPQLREHVSREDAAIVSRLKAAGAIFIGTTNIPTFAADWQSANPVHGVTNNPWDLSRTPGGSSGGAAAAVAAGFGFLGLGSDIGGSIRIPAHFCGVYGHKPTLDLVPIRGHIPPGPGALPRPLAFGFASLPVMGLLARDARDLMAGIGAVGGPDVDDAVAYRWSLPKPRGKRLKDYRIGYVLDDPGCRVSSELRPSLEGAVAALRKAGAKLERGWPKDLKVEEQYAAYLTLMFSVMALSSKPEDLDAIAKSAAQGDRFAATLQQAVVGPYRTFVEANGKRLAAFDAWRRYFKTHDAFLLPTAFVPAFKHDHRMPMNTRKLDTPEGPRAYTDLSFWIAPATLCGLPAVTAPVEPTQSGLPVGIQILGPYLEDATPIDIAARMAEIVEGFRSPSID